MNLQTSIDLDLKRFFQWWGQELAFLIPERVKRLLTDRSGTLLFTSRGADLELVFFRSGEQTAQKTWRLDANNPDSYRQLKAQNPDFDKADYVLRLDHDQALKKVVYLPAAAQENLQQVAGFELNRYTPFTAEQVYFSAVPVAKTELGQIEVLLILCPRAVLDEQLDKLHGLGINPMRVDYCLASTACPQTAPNYNLLPARYQANASLLAQSVHWMLNTVLAILLIAVLVWPVWQESLAVDTLKNQIKSLEKQTRVVEDQQLEIDALRQQTQRLLDIKIQSPSLVAVLNELSRLLKDDTWLTHFQFAEKRLQIQGQSPAASSLIGLLEDSAFFSNVSFVSPLTQDKSTGRERFQISMDVGALPVKAPETEPTVDVNEPPEPEPSVNGETAHE